MLDSGIPLVSVVTPTFNRADYLVETIESVLGQTYPHIEYIVLDDGSSDATRDVLSVYTGRLIWETHPNMGETRTINKGWQMVRGEYVMVVNSDDPILPETVEKMVLFMESHPNLLMAYPCWYVIDERSQIVGHNQSWEYDYAEMLSDCACYPGPGAIVRRKALELVPARDLRYKYVADFEYWLRLGLHGACARVPEYLATHRIHPDSAGVKVNAKIGQELIILMHEFFDRPDLPAAIRAHRRHAMSAAYFDAGKRVFPTNFWLGLWYTGYALLLDPRIKSSSTRRVSIQYIYNYARRYTLAQLPRLRLFLNPSNSLKRWERFLNIIRKPVHKTLRRR